MDKNVGPAEEVRLKYAPTEMLTWYSTGLLQSSMNHADSRYPTVHFRSVDRIQAVAQGFRCDHYLVNFATQSCTWGLQDGSTGQLFCRSRRRLVLCSVGHGLFYGTVYCAYIHILGRQAEIARIFCYMPTCNCNLGRKWYGINIISNHKCNIELALPSLNSTRLCDLQTR